MVLGKRLLKGVISFEMEKTYILVTEALGVDIKTYFSLLSKKFSFKTITLIAIQMVYIKIPYIMHIYIYIVMDTVYM